MAVWVAHNSEVAARTSRMLRVILRYVQSIYGFKLSAAGFGGTSVSNGF